MVSQTRKIILIFSNLGKSNQYLELIESLNREGVQIEVIFVGDAESTFYSEMVRQFQTMLEGIFVDFASMQIAWVERVHSHQRLRRE